MQPNFKKTKDVGLIFKNVIHFKNLIFKLKIQISTVDVFSKSQTVEMKECSCNKSLKNEKLHFPVKSLWTHFAPSHFRKEKMGYIW